jgi:hypothetical protein
MIVGHRKEPQCKISPDQLYRHGIFSLAWPFWPALYCVWQQTLHPNLAREEVIMRKILASPWKWVGIFPLLQFAGLILAPTVEIKMAISGLLFIGALFIMLGEKKKGLRFGITVFLMIMTGLFLAVYLNLSTWRISIF